MIERLAENFYALSVRERILLTCAAGILFPAAFAWGVAVPLMERREAAQAAIVDVQADKDWLSTQQDDQLRFLAETNGSVPSVSSASERRGLSGIETSLVNAGLREAVSFLGTPADDAVDLRLEKVVFTRLMSWLENTEHNAEYRLVRLTLMSTDAAGRVSAEVNLEALQTLRR